MRWLAERYKAVGPVSFRYDAESASRFGEPWRMCYVDADGVPQEAFLYACRGLPEGSTPEELERAELEAALSMASARAHLDRLGAAQARRSAELQDASALEHEAEAERLRALLEKPPSPPPPPLENLAFAHQIIRDLLVRDEEPPKPTPFQPPTETQVRFTLDASPPGSVWVVTSILPHARGWRATLQVKTPSGVILPDPTTYLAGATREGAVAAADEFLVQNPDPNKEIRL